MTRILCLWLPNWPIQRLIRSRPELDERPVALVRNEPRGGVVVLCCHRARGAGVQPGMPLAEAQALVRGLASAVYDPVADRRALEKLAEACERFSPRVAIEEGDEPESLLLDITNLEHLWGSEAELVDQVKEFFTKRGYRVRLAVAETVGAAWAAAHFERAGDPPLGQTGCRVPASSPTENCKLQNDHGKLQISSPSATNWQFRAPPEGWSCNLKFAISSLPVKALRIDDDSAALFHELGVETIDQLHSLPRAGLAARFGNELLHRLDQLTGLGREIIEPHRGLAPLEASHVLEEPTSDRFVLMHVLRQLVTELSQQLVARDQGAVLLICLLRCTNKQVVPLRVGLLQPSATARQLLELIELHLETVKLPDEIDRVETRAAVVGRLGERQRELFADRWSSDPHQLALLVNRLSSRLGEERVLRAKLRASPVPERAVEWRPVSGLRTKDLKRKDMETRRQGDKEKSWKSNSPCLPLSLSPCLSSRPLLLYPEAYPIEVTCVAPDGPPQFVWLENRRERVVHCFGPERIETLWWRGPSVRRDYYRVALESGVHWWIFRQLVDGDWFVHGVFS
jgi:protein ImuB